MKTVALVLALTAVASISVSALDQDQQSAQFSLAPKTQVRQFTLASPVGPRQFQISKPLKLRTELENTAVITLYQQIRLSPGMLESFNYSCLKLRTYRVKRIDNTDSTEPAGYTTCLRGNQVQMKSAVRQQQTNRDDGGWQ